MSDLGWGALARIDRRAFSGLGRDERYRMVRLAVSDAVWSTWRRYCEALGVSMGRGIVDLIANELGTVVDEDLDGAAVFAAALQRRLLERSEALDARERRLSEWEQRLKAAQRRVRAIVRPHDSAAQSAKVGRNEPCPCGSGFKFKRCHES